MCLKWPHFSADFECKYCMNFSRKGVFFVEAVSNVKDQSVNPDLQCQSGTAFTK
jgi:hypothetical protein